MFADVIENLSPEDAREGLYKVSNFVKQEKSRLPAPAVESLFHGLIT